MRWPWLAAVAALFLLFFYNLTGVGLIGPDEPRYAAIGRGMAESGDWLTPRLWGEPWFEKPPLLYWTTAAAFRVGLGDDLAPRLPIALISVAFLLLFWRILEREFGRTAALFSTGILATSAAWLAYSHVAVTDLPLAAAFSAAMLLALPWISRRDPRGLIWAGAMLGLAVLAKGLVPLVLVLPLLWMGRRHLQDLWKPALACLAVATPWYALATLRHGSAFLTDFFLKHHFARFANESLQHVQPLWFYVPVLLAGLLPWTPAVFLACRRSLYSDVRLRFLALWAGLGFVFFSAATNKLPGYLLPLVPAVCALTGVALSKAESPRRALTACALLLLLLPFAAAVLPEALAYGLSRARWTMPSIAVLLPVALIAAVAWLAGKTRAVAAIAAGMVAGILWLEASAFPALDRVASARAAWKTVAPRASEACVGDVNRGWRYSLNYYSRTPLPDCTVTSRPVRIERTRVATRP